MYLGVKVRSRTRDRLEVMLTWMGGEEKPTHQNMVAL